MSKIEAIICDRCGKVACRNGIIEYFQGVSTDGGLDMQGEPAQQPTYTGEEKPF